MGRNVVTQTAEIVERLEQLERHNRRQRCALYIIGGFAIVVVVAGAQGAPEVLDELRVKKLTIVSDDKWERCVFDGNGGEELRLGGPKRAARGTLYPCTIRNSNIESTLPSILGRESLTCDLPGIEHLCRTKATYRR
jgi:hypothetical protein